MSYKEWSPTFKDGLFAILYFAVLGISSLPGLFDWSNRIEPWVLGQPFMGFWQLFLVAVWVGIFIIQFMVEDRRGDLDIDVEIDLDYLKE